MLGRCSNERGVALIEVIVSITILLLLAGMATVTYTQIAVCNFEENTKDKLQNLTEGFLLYYDLNGSYPTQVADLASYTDANDVTRDAWKKDISYHQNIKVDGEDYPAAFISGGKDGSIESTVDADGNLTLATTDLYALVTSGMVEETRRKKTADKIGRADAALNVYLDTNPSPDPECQTDDSDKCILILYSEGLIEGKDCYDNWGYVLLLDTDTTAFYSIGPDGIKGNSDDVNW